MNTLDSAAMLREEGFDSVLVCGPQTGPEGDLLEEARARGIEPIVIPHLVREVSPRRDALALVELTRLLRRLRPSVVHTHTSKAGALGRIAARLAGVRVVVHTPHGHVFHGYFGRFGSALVVACERALAPLADALVELTDRSRREHLLKGIGRPERFFVIPSGVDSKRFDPQIYPVAEARKRLGLTAGAFVLGCFARLVPVKGVGVLLEAVRGEEGAVLLVAGDGPLRGELEEKARRLGVDARFLGLRRDVPWLMAACDVVVVPSLNEGMGRAAVEAALMGLPVVASRVSGLAEVVEHERTGLLVAPGDARALAEAIGRLRGDADLRARLGAAARERALGRYTVEAAVGALRRLYERLLETGGD